MRNSRSRLIRILLVLTVTTLLFCSLLAIPTTSDVTAGVNTSHKPARTATFDNFGADVEIERLLKLGAYEDFEPALASLLRPNWQQRQDEFVAANQKARSHGGNAP